MTDLDEMFAQARQSGPQPSAQLMARVLADARDLQMPPMARLPAVKPALPGLFDRLLGLFGGAGPVAGGVLAGIAGLAIGYLQPDGLVSLTDSLLTVSGSAVSIDLMPDFDTLLTEE